MSAPLYYGNQQIDEDLFRSGFEPRPNMLPHSYHAICPGCSKYFRFGKWSEEEEFRYPIDQFGMSHQWYQMHVKENHRDDEGNLVIKGIDDFIVHASGCAEPPSDGVHHVSRDSDKRLIELASFFSRFSHNEHGFGPLGGQATYDMLENGECEAYIMIEKGIPVSYVATTGRFFLEYVENGNMYCGGKVHTPEEIEQIKVFQNLEGDFRNHGHNWIISDVCTLPDYRRRGFSQKLLSHGIREKDMDISQLYVTIPLTEGSQALFSKMSTEFIVGCTPENYFAERKNLVDSISWVK